MELLNETGLAAEICLAEFPADQACLAVVIKGTFEITRTGPRLAADQIPVFFADQTYEKLDAPSAVLEGDLVPFKPRTDIVLLGRAHAPAGRASTAVDASIRVGDLRRTIRAIGNRTWLFGPDVPTITGPKPFETMDLVYERSYGGVDQLGGAVFEKNRVGRGFVVRVPQDSGEGVPLPNLEDPANPITSWKQQPDPVGFAFFPRSNVPRIHHLGTVDDAWSEHRAPDFPLDFKYDYHNGAHPDLQMEGYLSGTERVELTNVASRANIRFVLPGVRPRVRIWRHASESPAAVTGPEEAEAPDHSPLPEVRPSETPDVSLDTLVLLPEEERFYLVWRCRTSIQSFETLHAEIANIEVTLQQDS